LRFSISACCEYDSFASLPLPFRASFASGSVVDSCVAFERFSLWKSTVGLPGSSGGRPIAGLLVLLAKALKRCPRLDQCAVDGEVLVAHQPGGTSLRHDGEKEFLGDFMRDESLAVLGERAVIETRLLHVHVEEPAKQDVVVELLAEQPLAPHRIEGHQ
jgi:hypothetical protein